MLLQPLKSFLTLTLFNFVIETVDFENYYICRLTKTIKFTMESFKNRGLNNLFHQLGGCFPGNNDNYSDVTITCRDGQIAAHKLVLASISQILYSEFKLNTWDETISIVFPDVPSSEIHQYLNCVYNCKNLEKFSSINQLFGTILVKEEIITEIVKEENDFDLNDEDESFPQTSEGIILPINSKPISNKTKKRKINRNSLIWKHFQIEEASNGSDSMVHCNHCNASYHMSVVDLASMNSHLELMHPSHINIKPRKTRKRKIKSSKNDKIPSSSKDQKLNENQQLSLDFKYDEEVTNEEIKDIKHDEDVTNEEIKDDTYHKNIKNFISKYFVKTKGDTLLEGWKFTCNICSYQMIFKNKKDILMSTLKKHLLDEHQIRQLKKGPRNIEYWKHFKEIPDQQFLVGCKICSKQVTRTSMIRHLLIHDILPNEPSPCSICGKVFSNFLCRDKHERRHKQEMKFNCQVCGKQFKEARLLARHTRVHTGEKPFQVNEGCGSKSVYLKRIASV